MSVDTRNEFLVSVKGEEIAMLLPPRSPISKARALTLAAWLVALADDDSQFSAILDAVKNT